MAFAVISLQSHALRAYADEAGFDELPPIEAKAYDLKIVRPSRSGRVYLFQKSGQELPDLGRIFLLRTGDVPVMGFRVLKVYPENSQIAAKKVREYPGYERLPANSVYRAYEKVGDILTVPAQTPEDVTDLNDLEGTDSAGEVPPLPDGEPPLDMNEGGIEGEPPPEEPLTDEAPIEEPIEELPLEDGASDAADATAEPAIEPDASNDDPIETVEVDESAFRDEGSIDYFPNWIGIEVGGIRNSNLPASTYQRGFGLLYGKNLTHNILLNSTDYPDLLTLDAGFYYYKTNAIDGGVQKSYTMLPIKAQLRYTRPLSESFSFYLYGGAIYNAVVGQLNVSQDELNQIAVLAPALGLGGLIQFGPNWYIKLNLGLDTMAAGIVLRF